MPRWLFLGALVDAALIVVGILYVVIQAIQDFDGTCGGFIPALAGPHPCWIGEAIWQTLELILIWLLLAFPVTLGLLLVPPALFLAADRLQGKKS